MALCAAQADGWQGQPPMPLVALLVLLARHRHLRVVPEVGLPCRYDLRDLRDQHHCCLRRGTILLLCLLHLRGILRVPPLPLVARVVAPLHLHLSRGLLSVRCNRWDSSGRPLCRHRLLCRRRCQVQGPLRPSPQNQKAKTKTKMGTVRCRLVDRLVLMRCLLELLSLRDGRDGLHIVDIWQKLNVGSGKTL